MDFVYLVRHHFLIEKNQDTDDDEDGYAENRVTEWVFQNKDSAADHAIFLSLDLMGLDRHNLKGLEEVRIFKHLHQILKYGDEGVYKGIEVPCTSDEEGKRIDRDLVEIHKMKIMD